MAAAAAAGREAELNSHIVMVDAQVCGSLAPERNEGFGFQLDVPVSVVSKTKPGSTCAKSSLRWTS